MINYFFSGWIGNLGVDPLFLFIFFLVAPAFFFLFALLFSETLVLDTINKLLKSVLNQIGYSLLLGLWDTFVPISTLIVKRFMYVWPIFYYLLFLLAELSTPSAFASPPPIILSVGEHAELKLDGKVSYSVGNKDVLQHKYLIKEKKLLLQGKKMGATELLIFHNDQNSRPYEEKYQVYVFSKGHHLKIGQTKSLLKAIHLESSFDGQLLSISGKIKTLNHLKILREMVKKKKNEEEIFYLNVEIENKLQKIIKGKIYTYLLKEGINEISCEFNKLEIHCQYDASGSPSPETKKYLFEDLGVILHPIPSNKIFTNYQVEFELFQLEKSSGEEFSVGLSELNFNIRSFFEESFLNSYRPNQAKLRSQNLIFKTLAHPKIITSLDKKNVLHIGSDTPIKTMQKENDSIAIDWKFSGLKLIFKLVPKNHKIEIEYEIEMSESKDSSVNGTKESSSFLLDENYTGELFSAAITSQISQDDHIPFLGYFPIIGPLFSGLSKASAYKKIFLLIHIKPSGAKKDEYNNESNTNPNTI